MARRTWQFAATVWLLSLLLIVIGCRSTPQSSDHAQYRDADTKNADVRLLLQLGYEHIQLHGWRPFRCGRDDSAFFTNAFEADMKSTGAHMVGTICGSFTKGRTVRFQ